MTDPDVIIIGAGAAGLGAARRLAAAGLAVRVVEARNRLGGRAWTARSPSGLPIELGCAWLHSADQNELCAVAIQSGLPIDKTRPPRRSPIHHIGLAVADQSGDRLLEPGSRWNPLLNATSTYINGVELDQLSVHDFWRYRDTGVNWRVAEGYGSLMAALGAGLDITLDCPASLIDHAGPLVRIETPRGELRARAVIVTIPTDVLCAGALWFR